MKLRSRTVISSSLACLLVIAGRALAQSNWVPTGSGTQNWQTAVNWSTDPTIPNGAGVTANVTSNLTATQTIQLNGPVTLGTLNFGDPTTSFFSFTISNGTGGSLTFNNSGSEAQLTHTPASTATGTISAGITLTDDLGITNGSPSSRNNPLVLSGKITGPGKITVKTGTGFVWPSSTTNDFNGGVVINAGANFMTSSNSAAFGTGPVTINGGNITTAFPSAASQSLTTGNNQTWNGNWTLLRDTSDATWTNNGTVTLGANVTVTTSNNLTLAGAVGETDGPRNLTKAGNNTLSLNAANTYTGTTNVTAGTLSIGNANALQGTSGISLTNGTTLSSTMAALTISTPITRAGTTATATISYGRSTSAAGTLTLNSALSGSGAYTFSTPNNNSGGNNQTILLNAACTYTGATTITAGNQNNTNTVRSGVANALPATTVLTFTPNAGAGSGRTTTFDLNGNDQTLAGLASGTMVDNRIIRLTSSSAATLTINGTTNHSFGGITPTSGDTAAITGAISLVKNGTGTQTLAGAANTFNGTTTVLGGILSLGHTGSLQNSAFDTGASIAGTSTAGLRTTVTTVTLGGLVGGNDLSTRFITTSGGYTGLTGLTLNPGSGATRVYSGDVGNGAGSLILTKSGAGTQILSGTNTYAGATAVNGGTLLVNSPGSLQASSAVTVNGGTLGGTGTVGGAVTVAADGSVAPGASAGVLTVGGLDVSAMANGGTGKLNFELGADTASSDQLVVTGTLTNGASFGFNDFVFTNLGGLAVGTYTLITTGGISDPLDSGNLSGLLPGGLSGTLQRSGGGSGNNIELLVSGVAGYAAWQAANGTSGTRDQDHDNDGVDNGTEHFLGGNGNTTGFTALPTVINNAGTLSVTWTKDANYTGSYTTDFVVETSATLAGPWTTEAVGVNVNITGNDVKYTFPGGPAYSGKNFARLKVTGP